MNELPLSIRDRKPHINAIRITGTRDDGLPDGVHTGGAWLCPDNTVWKPLDGRPYVNSECHLPTLEAEVLTEFAGTPLFPKNWEVKEANGRRWLVRQEAFVYGKHLDWKDLEKDQVLEVESAIRRMNKAGWLINDPITLALDKSTYDLFLLDLSCAYKSEHLQELDSEEWRVLQWFREVVGFEWLAMLRNNAQMTVDPLSFQNEHPGKWKTHKHVYASFNRPISGLWASIPDAIYFQQDRAHWEKAIPWTWVVTPEEISPDILYRYELQWGWSPSIR